MDPLHAFFQAVNMTLFYDFLAVFVISYFILALGSYLIMYVFKRQRFSKLKIQESHPSTREIFREIGWSLLTLFIWSIMAVIMLYFVEAGKTGLYFDIREHGIVYFLLSIPFLIITHDAYFYFTHRQMHVTSFLFKHVHAVHHQSLNPTPFAIYAFGPVEAIIMAFYLYLVIFLVPINIFALLILFFFDTVANTLGHLGYELLPKKTRENYFGRMINTSIHHNIHHQYGRSNFSLYFPFWDTVCKSIDSEYGSAWEKFHAKKL